MDARVCQRLERLSDTLRSKEINTKLSFLDCFSWRTDNLLQSFMRGKKKRQRSEGVDVDQATTVTQRVNICRCTAGQIHVKVNLFSTTHRDERLHKVGQLHLVFQWTFQFTPFYTPTTWNYFSSVLHKLCQQTNFSVVLSQFIYEARIKMKHWMF